jgi:negative regulator of flagellin synthesis FlgM
MINGVGSSSPTRIGQTVDNGKIGATPDVAAPAATKNDAQPMTLITALAEAGPPIDSDKINAIRAAIAQGRYPIDPKAIARRMVEFDLPKHRA